MANTFYYHRCLEIPVSIIKWNVKIQLSRKLQIYSRSSYGYSVGKNPKQKKMSLLNYRCLLRTIFTYLHSDIILAPQPHFETSDVDIFFTESVQKSISPILLNKYVLYRLPNKYIFNIQIPNPLIKGNNYLPGTMYHRCNMFSDLIPLVLNLLTKRAIRAIGTYRKILLRRFMQLQDSSFCYWNQFLLLIKKDLFLSETSYNFRNRRDLFFIQEFIRGLKQSKALSFYLEYNSNLARGRLL